MLQDECLEYIREQYEEKNMVLGEFGEEVSAYTLYEDIFGDTTQQHIVSILAMFQSFINAHWQDMFGIAIYKHDWV